MWRRKTLRVNIIFTFHDLHQNSNTGSQTVQQLQDLSRDPVTKLQESPDPDSEPSSTSLDLLLRFQRLLVAKLFPLEQSKEKAIASDPGKYLKPWDLPLNNTAL